MDAVDQFFSALPNISAPTIIGLEIAPTRIDQDDPDRRVIQNGAQPYLIGAQLAVQVRVVQRLAQRHRDAGRQHQFVFTKFARLGRVQANRADQVITNGQRDDQHGDRAARLDILPAVRSPGHARIRADILDHQRLWMGQHIIHNRIIFDREVHP